ncbi:MAG: hypothetical protein LBB47_07135 [Spirochaetaceae bacterium]|jgi:hypothetical protein|nr:hypothetical protein [Spirochaetaceae bacterium]
MKRRFISRIAGLLSLYFVVFVLLSLVQFTDHGNLRRQIGALRINGSLRRQNKDAAVRQPAGGGREYLVQDGIQLSFGGLEFDLPGNVNGGLAYVDGEGLVQAAYPEAVTVSGNEVRIRLSDGLELSFHIDSRVDTKRLTISAVAAGVSEQLLLPFRANARASIGHSELNDFVVKYEGNEYNLEANIQEDRRLISLSPSNPVVFYRVILNHGMFDITGLTVSGGKEKLVYNEIAQNWRDAAFSYWGRLINEGSRAEETVTAYLAEAAQRGALAASINLLPDSFRNGTHTFLLTPFLGKLNDSLWSLLTNERESISRIAAFSESAPSDFLIRKDIFGYLYERGNKELFDRGIGYVKSLNPSAIDLNMCAGIFEGWLAWNKWMRTSQTENPFEKFLSDAQELISTNAKKDKANSRVFVADGGIDMLYNIRLGVSLINFSEAAGDSRWAALGRSLIVSALSFADQEVSLKAELELSGDGIFVSRESAESLTAARIYRELNFSNFYPHAFGAGNAAEGVWLWTSSPEISVNFQNNVLDFGFSFLPGETHYIYILNTKPFSRIQLRNMDWRSDPQFEQYNAPGWSYSPSEQVLMVKMVQINTLEHIRIVF